MTTPTIPATEDFLWPVIEALRVLGGSARIGEINDAIVESQGFTDEQVAVLNKRGRPYIYYRADWARSMLKRIGAVENSARGVWGLTDIGWSISESDCRAQFEQEMRGFREARDEDGDAVKIPVLQAKQDDTGLDSSHSAQNIDAEDDPDDWKSKLLGCLTEMPPAAFERLSQRLLLEAGFQNVRVTGRPGDGGIDGVGVCQISLVSFPVYFQCKRYRNAVQANAVRDFRGALDGRSERGLLITTGDFTKAAREEAVREGATPIDLVDGEGLCELLKQYQLGVKVTQRTVEDVDIDDEYFGRFDQ